MPTSGELDGAGVHVYSIGPGLVKTDTAQRAIEQVAALMGISIPEFYQMSQQHSALRAERSKIQRTGDQFHTGADRRRDRGAAKRRGGRRRQVGLDGLKPGISHVIAVYEEQYNGWLGRNVFEWQQMLRDFKKEVNCSSEQARHEFEELARLTDQEDAEAVRAKKNKPAHKPAGLLQAPA